MNPICEQCGGKCCKTLMLHAGHLTEEHKAFAMTRGIVAEGMWIIWARCRHLRESGECGIYQTRPKVCRDYVIEGSECNFIREHVPS